MEMEMGDGRWEMEDGGGGCDGRCGGKGEGGSGGCVVVVGSGCGGGWCLPGF